MNNVGYNKNVLLHWPQGGWLTSEDDLSLKVHLLFRNCFSVKNINNFTLNGLFNTCFNASDSYHYLYRSISSIIYFYFTTVPNLPFNIKLGRYTVQSNFSRFLKRHIFCAEPWCKWSILTNIDLLSLIYSHLLNSTSLQLVRLWYWSFRRKSFNWIDWRMIEASQRILGFLFSIYQPFQSDQFPMTSQRPNYL